MREQLTDECAILRLHQLKMGLIQFTDATNAMRLMKEHGKDIRYNEAWKKWVVWTEKVWKIDSGALIHSKGLEMVRNIYNELLKTADFKERIEIERYATLSESVRRREAFVKAESWIPDLNITTDDLDTNAWLLNVNNGTIDVLTGEFRDYKQSDLITKIAKVDYNPNADCPMWKQFIREIMNYKTDVIKYLQTAAGWALTGDISEQTMFILFGSGANGKSTFLNTIMYLLGDYATAASIETFMKNQAINILMILRV